MAASPIKKLFGQWKTHCPKTHSQHFTRRLESAPRHWPSHPSSSSQHLKNVGGLWARRFFFPTWFVKILRDHCRLTPSFG
jgi:hypothetical protein